MLSGRSETHEVSASKGNLKSAPPESVISRRKGRAVASTIYKICDGMLWREAERAGGFPGACGHAPAGFFSFSSAGSVPPSPAQPFSGALNFLSLPVAADGPGAALQRGVSGDR